MEKASQVALSNERVQSIFEYCLLKDDEDTVNHLVVEGVQLTASFHPLRLEERRNDIFEMLRELPIDFIEHRAVGVAASLKPSTTSTASYGQAASKLPICCF